MIGTGLILGVGTRIALWAAFVASLLTYSMLVMIKTRVGASTYDRGGAIAIVLGLSAGIAALAALYPAAFLHPLDLMAQSLTVSSDYPYVGFTLTAGELLSENPPWWYLPAWTFASTPVLIFALAAVAACGCVFVISSTMLSRNQSHIRALATRQELSVVLVLQQALLLPLVTVLGGATIYTGLRQHLYVVPAVAILCGLDG